MSFLNRDLMFLILQFLDEEKYNDTMHKLEKESGIFFNMKYFEEMVSNGDWEEVENYLSGFTKVDDNRYSMKIIFEIRKHKYLEALEKKDYENAVSILTNDLKYFSTFNADLYKEITCLVTLNNFRENEHLTKYGDTKSARAIMLIELKKLIEANPLFHDKLQFPTLNTARLRTMINQSLCWQHHLCKTKNVNPDVRTIFVDHTCGQSSSAAAAIRPPSPAPLMPQVRSFPSIGAPFQPASASAVPASTVPPSLFIGIPNNSIAASTSKRPRSPSTTTMDFTADSDYVLRRTRPFGIVDEANNLPVNILPVTYPGPSHVPSGYSSDDLPKNVVLNLAQGSAIKIMVFHPFQTTLLLVGTNIGDVSLWEVSTRQRVAHRNFKVWDIGSCSIALQAALLKEYSASVNRVTWSPDGALFGVAYSKHIVHLYSYHGGSDLRNYREIDAHVGNVNDVAFAYPNKHLCLITCGDDKTIKVWDVATGSRLFTFQGHETAVYSVLPHFKEHIQFVFSTATDGRIKAWLYDNMGSRADYDTPGLSCTTLAYTADATRLFSCGTNKQGESYLVEWNETEGRVKRSYAGLGQRTVGIVQFDTVRNKFLAVGDEFSVKIWDMDELNVIKTIDADGGLQASPCIRFNKEGNLLAVSTRENGIKILANAEGARMLRAMENHALLASRVAFSRASKSFAAAFGASSSNAGLSISVPDRNAAVTSLVAPNGNNQSLTEVTPRTIIEELEKSKLWKLSEMNEPSQIRSLRLSDSLLEVKVIRLAYTHSGTSILALANNAVHKVWKWPKTEQNETGKATSAVQPLVWQPASGFIMTNDIIETTNAEEVLPCFALSKNDSYVISASGGKITLFNMMTFKPMTTFTTPPPAATFLAFLPQDNNIIAMGMEDTTIQIYNVRTDEVKCKLIGHEKRVTGLAFSNLLNVLVSTGADSQICVWSTDDWENKGNKFLQIPSGCVVSPQAQTRVQFHLDQTHILVVHETQLAIYEASKLDCTKQWVTREPGLTIIDATYSCDGQSVYANLDDGSICIFTAGGLKLKCRISPNAYLPSNLSVNVHPLVIAAHPSEPNQFAIGLTDGSIHVLEPPEAEGEWGTAPPVDESDAASTSITPTLPGGGDQASR